MEKKQKAVASTSRGRKKSGQQDEDDFVSLVSGQGKLGETVGGCSADAKMPHQIARHLDSNVFSGHLIDAITDEVALEGLDGITVQALKLRLEERPNFDIDGFEDVAPAIWRQIVRSNFFRFYMLPKARPDLQTYCWDDYRDNRGNAYEPIHAPEEIYLYHPIDAKNIGIRGSCMDHETRKDITHVIKTSSYTDLIQLFGNRLVIVANQAVREKALFGLNFKKYKSLNIVQYCIMERVGRSRYSGEITRGKISSTCMNIPPKTLFYMRKHLISQGLILRQSVSVRFANSRCPALVTVFHLPRFYKRIESISSLNTRTVFTWLNNSPTKSVPVEVIVSKYGKHTMRALTATFATLVETAWDTVVVDNFDDDDEEKKKKPKSRTVRVLRLKQCDLKLQSQLISKVLDGQNVEEVDLNVETTAEAQDEGEEQINIASASSFKGVQVLRPAHMSVTNTESQRLFQALVRAGVGGLTLLDISMLMSLTPLEARSSTRYLTRNKACKEGMVKIYKQKAFTYILSTFSSVDMDIHMTMQEKFMLATTQIEKIRQAVERREKKKIAKRIKMAKKLRARREKREKEATDITTAADDTATADAEIPATAGADNNAAVTADNITATVVENDASAAVTTTAAAVETEQQCVPDPAAVVSVEDVDSRSTEQAVEAVDENKDQEIDKNGRRERHRSRSSSPEKKRHSKHKSKHRDTTSPSRHSSKSTKCEQMIVRIPIKRLISPDKEIQEAAEKAIATPSLCLVRGSSPTKVSGILDRAKILPTMPIVRPTSEVSPEEEQRATEETEKAAAIEEILELDEEEVRFIFSDNEGSKTYRRGDAVDDEIKRRMIRRRVDWKPFEDRFIMLSFIASSLFISKYNYNKLFFYNAPQVRDIMLKQSNGTSNKTSAAIRRRIHFILHQQQRFEQYIRLAGASLRDNKLYEEYLKVHMRPPQQKIYCNPPIEALESVINYLFRKFTEDEEKRVIADTSNSLSGIDTLLFLRQLKRAEFYWNATKFAIFCPMGTTSTSRREFYKSWRTFRRELRDNQAEVNTDQDEGKMDTEAEKEAGSTSSGKVVKATGKESDVQKAAQELYLEYCFRFLRFVTKHCVFMFNSMLLFASLNLRGFQIVSVDMSTAHSNISTCVRECKSIAEVRLYTARSIVLDYIFSGDSTKLLEKQTVDRNKFPLERAARSLARAKVLVHSKRTGLLAVSRVNLRNFINGLPAYSYDEMLDFLKYLDEASTVDSLACISVGILCGIVELTDYFHTTITVTESIFTLNDDLVALYEGMANEMEETPAQKSAKKKAASKVVAVKSKPKVQHHHKRRRRHAGSSEKGESKHSSRRRRYSDEEEVEIDSLIDDECFEDIENETLESSPPQSPPKNTRVGLEAGESYISSSNANALRLLRIRLNQAACLGNKNFTGFVEKDFFTLNLPSLEFHFPSRGSLNHKIAGSSHPFTSEDLKDLRKGLVELVFHRVPAATFKAPNMEKMLGKHTTLFNIISMSGVVGLTGAYLSSIFEFKTLIKGLKYLLDAKLLFSVGVAHRRFVTYNNINDWVIPIRPRVGSGSVGHVIMRPWISSMGGLSWITVSRLLTSLLGQLQDPAVSFNELCLIFAPTLSPVEATVLVETLAQLKYLTIYRIREPDTTVFSKPTAPDAADIEYNANTLVDTSNVYVAISPYLTFLHAQLNQAIQKAYKKQIMGLSELQRT